ncbi:MAG: CDP-alcohol phosphatidyltransferase family protein [Bacteroidia bacterium]|nr:CDP-alcohol phosphatidyltransferase family protein [Bacteroidia bacterium]NNJ55748.1 hypothetical protein [Bacteroidia bacterium]
MNLKNQIPNLFTLGNLLCGVLIIIASFQANFNLVLILAITALVFDFLDGTVARLLNVGSTMGKELDSLADVVSFGVAPSLVLFHYWKNEIVDSELLRGILPLDFYHIALLIALFAAYRLAKFNSMEQSNEYFVGLPTPMFSITAFSIPFAAEQSLTLNSWMNSPLFILLFVVLGGVLMISNLKLLSIKIGSSIKQLNIARVLMIALCLVLILLLKFFGVFLCLLVYLVFSLITQKYLS